MTWPLVAFLAISKKVFGMSRVTCLVTASTRKYSSSMPNEYESVIATSGRLRWVSADARERSFEFGVSGERSICTLRVRPMRDVRAAITPGGRPPMTPEPSKSSARNEARGFYKLLNKPDYLL